MGREEDVFLALEVAEERRDGHLRLFGHQLDGGALVSTLLEQAEGGRHQSLAGLLFLAFPQPIQLLGLVHVPHHTSEMALTPIWKSLTDMRDARNFVGAAERKART
jgi:hypothetical protein